MGDEGSAKGLVLPPEMALAYDFHHHYLSGLILSALREMGADAASEMVFRLFRGQHGQKFIAALDSLGLADRPDPVACAQYFYLSNHIGGVRVECVVESERKAWVRYLPPRWIYEGAAICAIPSNLSKAFMRGFHSHCGATLGNPRLGYCCTKQTVDGDPCLEGYFYLADRDLAPDERLRFAPDEDGPDCDPEALPRLDPAAWPRERLQKARRNYALTYLRTLFPVMLEMFGADECARIGRHTGKLIGMHVYDGAAAHLGPVSRDADGFARVLVALIEGGGNPASVDGACIESPAWRLGDGLEPASPAYFDAWNGIVEGAAQAHNRRLRVTVEGRRDRGDALWRWRIGRDDRRVAGSQAGH